jgi:hypothetical protein
VLGLGLSKLELKIFETLHEELFFKNESKQHGIESKDE